MGKYKHLFLIRGKDKFYYGSFLQPGSYTGLPYTRENLSNLLAIWTSVVETAAMSSVNSVRVTLEYNWTPLVVILRGRRLGTTYVFNARMMALQM